MAEIPRPFDRAQDELQPASRWRTASVIPLENGIQVKGMGMDPGFHRGDDKAGMTEKKVDFQSTNLERLGLKPRVVQFGVGGIGLNNLQKNLFSEVAQMERNRIREQ